MDDIARCQYAKVLSFYNLVQTLRVSNQRSNLKSEYWSFETYGSIDF